VKPGFFRNLLLGMLILALLGFLLTRSRMVDSDEHYGYLGTIAQLQELEVAFNETILRSRHAYLANYDPLVEVLARLGSIAAELTVLPGFLSADERMALRGLLADYEKLAVQRQELSERFKSDNAILHNSLSFFPIAASESAERIMGREPRLARELQDLLRDIFMYNLYSHHEILPRLEQRLAKLRRPGKRPRLSDHPGWERNMRHAEIIINYKRQLDQTTIATLNLPTSKVLLDINHHYQKGYLRALASANNHRLALYLVAIILAAGIAYVMIYRYNAGEALRRVNASLEEKVRLRTEELRHLAMTDDLTGLYSRRFAFEWLEKQLAATHRQQGVISCLMLDVDHFKEVNDTLGHIEGDRVLQRIGATIMANIREADIASRFGGEEFLVLLPEASGESAGLVAEKIRLAVADADGPAKVTISIGIACCDCRQPCTGSEVSGQLITELLNEADKALYQAKEQGRNRIQIRDRVICAAWRQ